MANKIFNAKIILVLFIYYYSIYLLNAVCFCLFWPNKLSKCWKSINNGQ